MHVRLLALCLAATACLAISSDALADDELAPYSVSDYDNGEVFFLRGGKKRPYNGVRESWVFNRAMTCHAPHHMNNKKGRVLRFTAADLLPFATRRINAPRC